MTGSRWRRWPAQAEHGRLVGRVSGSDSLGLCTQGGYSASNAHWNASDLRGPGKLCEARGNHAAVGSSGDAGTSAPAAGAQPPIPARTTAPAPLA